MPEIDTLFRAMCDAKASDLHLSSTMPPLLRLDGSMMPLDAARPPLSPAEIEALLEPIMPKENQEEFKQRRDTDFAYEVAGLARFRANVFMDRKGPGAVFR